MYFESLEDSNFGEKVSLEIFKVFSRPHLHVSSPPVQRESTPLLFYYVLTACCKMINFGSMC